MDADRTAGGVVEGGDQLGLSMVVVVFVVGVAEGGVGALFGGGVSERRSG